MEINGTIYRIDPVQEFSSGFKKRNVVVQSGKDFYLVSITKDDISLLDVYNVGDTISLNTFVNGRKWVNKDGVEMFFTDLNGTIKPSADKRVVNEAVQSAASAEKESVKAEPITVNIDVDDLPF